MAAAGNLRAAPAPTAPIWQLQLAMAMAWILALDGIEYRVLGTGYRVYANFLILTFRSQGGRGPFHSRVKAAPKIAFPYCPVYHDFYC